MSSSTDARREYIELFPLAKGGMGTVAVAVKERGSFSRLYALKRLHPALVTDRKLVAQFTDEARIAGMIRDSHVVSVLDVGTDADGPYLVMDLIEGVPLFHVVREARRLGEPLPLGLCLDVLQQAALGLHAAHDLTDHTGRLLEVVHRDVSPSNLLVGFDGVVRVADFGIARALDRQTETQTGQVKGKLGYLSPEQIRSEPLDRRSDLFSLGIVMFEMLTATRLYKEGPSAILRDAPPDLGEYRDDAPDALVELVIDCLSKLPEHRPATALEVAERLDALRTDWLGFEGGSSLREHLEEHFAEDRDHLRGRIADAIDALQSSAQRSRRRRLLRPFAFAAAGGVAILAGIGGAFALMDGAPAPATPSPAAIESRELLANPPTPAAPAAEPSAAEESETEPPEEVAERPRRPRARRRRPARRTQRSTERPEAPPTVGGVRILDYDE